MLTRLGLLALALLAGAGVPAPVVAENHVTAQAPVDPAAARTDLRAKATAMETRLAAIIADLDAEIARQEEASGFGASEEVLGQIDRLKASRDGFAGQLAQVRALITDLDEAN